MTQRHVAPTRYGDQTLSAGEHLAAGFSQWRVALAAWTFIYVCYIVIILGVWEFFLSLYHFVSIFLSFLFWFLINVSLTQAYWEFTTTCKHVLHTCHTSAHDIFASMCVYGCVHVFMNVCTLLCTRVCLWALMYVCHQHVCCYAWVFYILVTGCTCMHVSRCFVCEAWWESVVNRCAHGRLAASVPAWQAAWLCMHMCSLIQMRSAKTCTCTN